MKCFLQSYNLIESLQTKFCVLRLSPSPGSSGYLFVFVLSQKRVKKRP